MNKAVSHDVRIWESIDALSGRSHKHWLADLWKRGVLLETDLELAQCGVSLSSIYQQPWAKTTKLFRAVERFTGEPCLPQ